MILNIENGEMDSPIEVLYNYYAERYPIRNDAVWARTSALTELVPPELREQVMAAISLLVEEHEREAFIRGLQTGIRLAQELEQP